MNSPAAELQASYATLAQMQTVMQQLKAAECSPAVFCKAWRDASMRLPALPLRYTRVLSEYLDRYESSALFSEESCSFSQQDLLYALQGWQAQATLFLQQNHPPTA